MSMIRENLVRGSWCEHGSVVRSVSQAGITPFVNNAEEATSRVAKALRRRFRCLSPFLISASILSFLSDETFHERS